MKKFLKWFIPIAFIIIIIITILYYSIFLPNACIPSSCDRVCTDDCGGKVSYIKVYFAGFVNLLLAIFWFKIFIFNKKK